MPKAPYSQIPHVNVKSNYEVPLRLFLSPCNILSTFKHNLQGFDNPAKPKDTLYKEGRPRMSPEPVCLY